MFKRLRLFWQTWKDLRAMRRGDMSSDDMAEALLRNAARASGDDPDDIVFGPGIDLSDTAQDALLEPDFDQIYPETFTLTASHVRLIRAMRLGWNGAESGAPQQDLQRPFVTGTSLDLISDVLGPDASEDAKVAFVIERVAALRAFCAEATLAPGLYTIRNLTRDDLDAALGWLEGWEDRVGTDAEMRIELTEDDIALAREAQWQWPYEDDMYGAFSDGEIAGPTVDPKRPYGDMSYIDLDVHRILDWPVEQRDEDGHIRPSDAQSERVGVLHFRQLAVMQVMLEQGTHPVDEAA